MHDWNSSEIASIHIRSLWTGSVGSHSQYAMTDIERWGESFLASDQFDDRPANDVERRVIATDMINRLLEAVREPPMIEPDPINMGITPEWFHGQVGEWIDKAAEGYSDEGKKRLAERAGNYEFYCSQILSIFHAEWTSDDPQLHVCIEGSSGEELQLHSSSQHPFMLPWTLGRRKTSTFNTHISRAVAALLPNGFPNKDRLAFLQSQLDIFHDAHDELLDVPVRSLAGHSRSICSLFFTPDGESLVSGGMDNVVKIWDPNNWTVRHKFDMPRIGVNLAVDLAPNGRTLAFNDASVIKLVDIETGQIIRELKGHTWVVRKLTFLPDGTQLVSEDSDGVRHWDAMTGQELQNEPGKQLPGLASFESYRRRNPIIDYSNRRMQASVSVSETRHDGQVVTIHDCTTRKTLNRIMTTEIETIALPPHGRHLVTGHTDGHLAVWPLAAN